MEEKKRTVGYICPSCGKAVLEEKSVFALTAGPVEIGCSCGQSRLRLESDGRRFRLWVPCGLCGETHRAECAAKQLLEGPGVGLACTRTGQLCCYVGEAGRVAQAMENLQCMTEKQAAAREDGDREALFLDSVIMHEVLAELGEIAARPDGIRCSCGSRCYRMAVRYAAVDLICADCGARLRIPAATDEDLDRLCCRMKLQIPGR